MRRCLIAAAVIAVAAATAVPSVFAQSYSPSITPASIAVEDVLSRGAAHTLPALAVRNEGGEAIEIVMSATPREGASAADASWVAFDPAGFVLGAGETRAVTVTLTVPPATDFGVRDLWLNATVGPRVDPTGVSVAVGAAVASSLRFEVGEPAAPADQGAIELALSQWPVVVAAILAGGVAYLLAGMARRYRLRVSFERREPEERVDHDPPSA